MDWMHKSPNAFVTVLFLLQSNPQCDHMARHAPLPCIFSLPLLRMLYCIMLRDITRSVEQPRLSPSVSHAVRHAGTDTPPPPTPSQQLHATRWSTIKCTWRISEVFHLKFPPSFNQTCANTRNLKSSGDACGKSDTVDQHYIHYIMWFWLTTSSPRAPPSPSLHNSSTYRTLGVRYVSHKTLAQTGAARTHNCALSLLWFYYERARLKNHVLGKWINSSS